jgi:hypothetical protein
MKVDADKFSSLVPRSWNPVIQSHFDALRPQFESKGKLVKHWYQPIAMSIRDIFDQADLSKHYEEAYSPLSAIEHSDINTFFAMTQQMEGGGNHRQLAVQSDLFVPHYLRNAFQYFGDIFRICNKTIPLTDGLQLEQTIKAGLAFHKADMQKRGMTP